MFLQFNQFTHVGDQTMKINDPIAITENFSLSPGFVRSGQGGDYTCDAFIQHIGSTPKGGHYVGYVKKPDNTWWCCNDSCISSVTPKKALAALQRSYIAHYKKL